MNRAHWRMVERGIRQLKLRVEEQREIFKDLPERFPSAHCEALEELLERFGRRLRAEPIQEGAHGSTDPLPLDGPPVLISAHPSREAGQSVKPRPEPDTGRGVFLSGKPRKD